MGNNMTDELLQQAIASGQVSAAQIEQHRAAGELTQREDAVLRNAARSSATVVGKAQPIKQGEQQ